MRMMSSSGGPRDPMGYRVPQIMEEVQTEASAAAAARARARWRRIRRRSRSLIPPQMPNFSPFWRAYSRQSSRTTHPRQTSFASRVDAPLSGKKRSGSTPRQFAKSCHVGSSFSDAPAIFIVCRVLQVHLPPRANMTMSPVRLQFDDFAGCQRCNYNTVTIAM